MMTSHEPLPQDDDLLPEPPLPPVHLALNPSPVHNSSSSLPNITTNAPFANLPPGNPTGPPTSMLNVASNTTPPTNIISLASLTPGQLEQYQQLNQEYIRKKYRRKYEQPEKSKELLQDSMNIVEHLKTAYEGKMEVAIVGVLQQIIVSLDNGHLYTTGVPNTTTTGVPNTHPGGILQEKVSEASISKSNIDPSDRQRALCKANIATVLYQILRDLGGQVSVCERVLHCIAYLCRHQDENKASICLENCKALGVLGICDVIIAALKRFQNDKRIVEVACDSIRCLCALESNRERFYQIRAAEVLVRTLPKYLNDAEVVAFLCRAIGHVVNNHVGNQELASSNGGCENIIVALQKYPNNVAICTEACWALRQLATFEACRNRIVTDFGPESILAVFKTHLHHEAFAIESTRVFATLLEVGAAHYAELLERQAQEAEENRGEDIEDVNEELATRIATSGFITYAIRALKKSPHNDVLPRYIYMIFYYLALSEQGKYTNKLVTGEVLDALSISLENHASEEHMAEWGCRFVHQVIAQENASNKMRQAGINEMITSAVQRQAISPTVSSVGCLAIGDLACDSDNLSRLSSAGACEAVVGALKRHVNSIEVCYNSCYAIHYLCQVANNVSWMGAYGACEAVVQAIEKHLHHSEEVAKYAVNALGSLANKDEGNQSRILQANGNYHIVQSLTMYSGHADIVENACRAIYHLCAEPSNVSELGKHGACGLVVTALQTHASNPTVITQCLLAIHALAVKLKSEKVHRGNTRKLVEQGAIENVVAVMQRFQDIESVQRAAGMAITSLARLEANRGKLGQFGACELVSHALQLHLNSANVVSKLALAIDALAMHSDENTAKFTALLVLDKLLLAIHKHEKSAFLVADSLRAMITLSSVDVNKHKVASEAAIKQYVKVLKLHEKQVEVANWTCHMIYAIASSSNHDENIDEKRSWLGQARACEQVIAVLVRHGENSVDVAGFGCKAMVSLSLFDGNKERFHTTEACTALIKILQKHYTDDVVTEWCLAAIVSLASFSSNKTRLGGVSLAKAMVQAINHQYTLLTTPPAAATGHGAPGAHGAAPSTGAHGSHGAAGAHGHGSEKAGGESPVHHHGPIIDRTKTHEAIIRLLCEVCYEVCTNEKNNQKVFYENEITATFMKLFVYYHKQIPHVTIAGYVCKAFSSYASNNLDISNQLLDLGVASLLIKAMTTSVSYRQSATYMQWASALIVALCSAKNLRAQTILGDRATHTLETLAETLVYHHGQHVAHTTNNTLATTVSILRGIRAIVSNHPDNQHQVAKNISILPLCMELIRLYKNSDGIVENCAYLLGNIEYKVGSSGQGKGGNAGAVAQRAASPEPDASSSSSAVHVMTWRELYSNPAHYDILYAALLQYDTVKKQASVKIPVLRWLACAISVMAEKGKLAHRKLCELLMQVLDHYVEQDIVTQRVLFAIGSLAKTHVENSETFARLNVCEVLNDLIKTYIEGNIVIYGVFAAVAGMCVTAGKVGDNKQNQANALPIANVINQDHFHLVSHILPSLIKILYNDLETEAIAQYGCHALYTLVYEHAQNQQKASSVCNFIADVMIVHKLTSRKLQQPVSSTTTTDSSAAPVLTANSLAISQAASTAYNIQVEACKAISALAHKQALNRNRLGSNDACSAVLLNLSFKLDDEINQSWRQYSSHLLFWALQAVGNLAANHPANQQKLGYFGSCEVLVKILRQRKHVAAEALFEEKIFAIVFWVIGNLVQLGKGPSMIIHEDGGNNGGGLGALGEDFYGEVMQLGSKISMSLPQSPLKGANTSAGGNGSSLMHHSSSADMVGAIASETANNTATAATTKFTKNTTRFYEAGISEALNTVLRRYQDSPTLVTWACRAINNLSKSQRLKVDFLDKGVLETLHGILQKYQSSTQQDLMEWANLAKESLMSSNADN